MDALFGWDQGLTLLAPLLAIGVALASRRVFPALLAGVLVAGVVAHRGVLVGDAGALSACFFGGEACDRDTRGALGGVVAYAGEAMLDVDNLTIASFTMLVAAMIGVMGASGATRTLVGAVERVARGPRGAMLASWLGGFVVFFDDYANCLVVGSAMGPVCDRHGVSRAKLAYIVDSTAAPVASLAVVSTWVGYEVGLLDQALSSLGRDGGGFELFLRALPYSFYGFFALGLVGILSVTGRDLGPMLEVEREARRVVASEPREAFTPPPWGAVWLAAAPVGVLLAVTLGWMVHTGVAAMDGPVAEQPLYAILADADAYRAMLYGAGAGWLVASGVALGGLALRPADWMRASLGGARTVAEALAVLYLAWTLGNAIGDSGAREFLLTALGDRFPPSLLPSATFMLAAVVAFATGTSFGTMSILVPLAVPLAIQLGGDALGIVAGTTAAVLAGACLGDHASPISDTTVLSAAGARCDLVQHVRTQLPYALLAGGFALLLGFLPAGLGVSPWLCVSVGLVGLYVVVRLVGRDPGDGVRHGRAKAA